MLSRIDGASRPNDIISVSPMAEAETARALMDLLGKGLIRLGGVTREPVSVRSRAPSAIDVTTEAVHSPPRPLRKTDGPPPEVVADVDRLLALADAEDYPALLDLPC